MKPVSLTAFYCCGVRMWDAESAHPVCGDRYAVRFMNDRGREVLELFRGLRGPNMSTVARHRLIDDLVRAELARSPDLTIVTIGAGFDTRPFRLPGGRWLEFDEPALIAYKNERLPVNEAGNQVVRVPIDFATRCLAEVLAPYATDQEALVVIEGVTMYLEEAELGELAATIRRLFPAAVILADLMTPAFRRSYGRPMQPVLRQLGTAFTEGRVHPRTLVEGAGYRIRACHGITGAAMRYRGLPDLSWLFRVLMPVLTTGYAVWVFEPGPPAPAERR
jgi:methyltransferase (TIGR00027 family)